jgi:hypothetical protein
MATADVLAAAAQVAQDLRVITTALFKGVGQRGEAVVVERARGQLALLIGCLGETEYGAFIPRKPIRFNADGAEAVAHDVTQKRSLPSALGPNAGRLLLCRGLDSVTNDTICDLQHVSETKGRPARTKKQSCCVLDRFGARSRRLRMCLWARL